MKTSDFNQYPKTDLQKKKKGAVRILAKDEVVTFRWLDQKPDTENPGQIIMPAQCNIPPQDQVWVPVDYEKPDKESGERFDIGYIVRTKADGSAEFGAIDTGKSARGLIPVVGSKRNSQQLFEYLSLSNYNASNPLRDKRTIPLYELVDANAEAKRKRDVRKKKREALEAIESMPEEWLREVSVPFLSNAKTDGIEVIKDFLEEKAEEDPQDILKFIKNKYSAINRVLQESVKKDIISHNTKDQKFFWSESGELIIDYSYIKVGESPYNELAKKLSEDSASIETIRARVGIL